jgi:hypothetical protein
MFHADGRKFKMQLRAFFCNLFSFHRIWTINSYFLPVILDDDAELSSPLLKSAAAIL